MSRTLLASLCWVLFGIDIVVAAEKPTAAAMLTETAGIELAKTERLLDLQKDFTIEILAKWQSGTNYLATDEVWPGMSDQLKVTEAAGWALRTKLENGRETLDFTVATLEQQWISLTADIPLKRPEWNHIAVGRRKEMLVLFFNGVLLSQKQLGGLTLVKSPTPMYLGVRTHSFGNRQMNGYIAKFAVAQTFRFPQGPKPALLFKNDKQTLLCLSLDTQQEGAIPDSSGNGHVGLPRGAEIVNLE